jgi:hypothetical protein
MHLDGGISHLGGAEPKAKRKRRGRRGEGWKTTAIQGDH